MAEHKEVSGWVSEGVCAAQQHHGVCCRDSAPHPAGPCLWDECFLPGGVHGICPAQHRHTRTWSHFLCLLLAALWCRCSGLAAGVTLCELPKENTWKTTPAP